MDISGCMSRSGTKPSPLQPLRHEFFVSPSGTCSYLRRFKHETNPNTRLATAQSIPRDNCSAKVNANFQLSTAVCFSGIERESPEVATKRNAEVVRSERMTLHRCTPSRYYIRPARIASSPLQHRQTISEAA